MLKFPDGFQWGAATAAHQVEGGNDNNDWWDWEQTPGHIKNGDKSVGACDWWKNARYHEDFELARTLHMGAQRLSVEWSRLEPRQGEWNEEAFAFYRQMLASVHDCGMVPLVTLHHFSNPRWLAEKGAWETEAVVPLFERLVTKVVQELGDLCDFWVTINEPIVYMVSGYVTGQWPPGKHNIRLALKVAGNLLRGHAAAYRAIHNLQPQARVGLAHNIHHFRPSNPRSPLDRGITRLQNWMYNDLFLDALKDGAMSFPLGRGVIPGLQGSQDFFGLNYYFSTRIAADFAKPGQLFGRQLTAKPWGVPYDSELDKWFGKGDIDPEAFYQVCKSVARFGIPIYITENGIADRHDELRPKYLVSHLASLHRAIQEGVPIKGYFYWSLLDNFEWAEGYTLPFGLIHTDFDSQERTLKPSASVFARIASENGIPDALIEEYCQGETNAVGTRQID